MTPFRLTVLVLMANIAACDQLGLGHRDDGPDGAPTEQELKKISYMSTAESGPNGRKLYEHLEQAKRCGDYELALRWNRPPNVEGGVFHKKLVYLTQGVPADLPKESEVFLKGRIERTDSMTAGGFVWYVTLADGTRVQAVEMANFLEKQDQLAQDGKYVALVKPNKPGRAFCGQGVYQGVAGKSPDSETKIPQFSMLFVMDRDR